MDPIFTCDLEDWNHGLHVEKNGHSSIDSLWWLLFKLQDYDTHGIFYMLGAFNKEQPHIGELLKFANHVVKSHGVNHIRGEHADRQPYSWLGFTGGFYFRFFPYWFIKWQILRKGMFYIHPHDLDEEHPKLKNPLLNWKRHVGLKTARAKLERLLKEVKFDDPANYEGL